MNIGLVIYGDIHTLTGGYIYDRHIVEYLRDSGHSVSIRSQKRRRYFENILANFDRENLNDIISSQFDILLQDELNHPSLFFLNRRLKRQIQIPIISVVHVLRNHSSLSGWQRVLTKWIESSYLRSVDGYICISQRTKDQVYDLIPKKKKTIVAYPAGDRLTPDITENEIRHRSGNTRTFRILYLGNITRRKQPHILIQAMKSLTSVPLHLTLIGDEQMESGYARHIRRLVSEYELADSVEFVGRVRDQIIIAEYLAVAHLLVLPSRLEGLPLVHLEAAGFGVPSVATTESAAPEIITHGKSGFLLSPGDHGGLASIISNLHQNRKYLAAVSLGALEMYRNHPGWRDTCREVETFLQKMYANS